MKKGTKIVLGVIAVVIVIFVVVKMTGNASAEPGKYDSFAQCLTDSEAKMYGSYLCPHCTRQKEDFGKSWKYVDYIECTLPNGGQTPKCTEARIEGYPTWEFSDGERTSGYTPLSELSLRTGCELPA